MPLVLNRGKENETKSSINATNFPLAAAADVFVDHHSVHHEVN